MSYTAYAKKLFVEVRPHLVRFAPGLAVAAASLLYAAQYYRASGYKEELAKKSLEVNTLKRRVATLSAEKGALERRPSTDDLQSRLEVAERNARSAATILRSERQEKRIAMLTLFARFVKSARTIRELRAQYRAKLVEREMLEASFDEEYEKLQKAYDELAGTKPIQVKSNNPFKNVLPSPPKSDSGASTSSVDSSTSVQTAFFLGSVAPRDDGYFHPPASIDTVKADDLTMSLVEQVEAWKIHMRDLNQKAIDATGKWLRHEGAIMDEATYWLTKKAVPKSWLSIAVSPEARDKIAAMRAKHARPSSSRFTRRPTGPRSHTNGVVTHQHGACPTPLVSDVVDGAANVGPSKSSGAKVFSKPAQRGPAPIVAPVPVVTLTQVQKEQMEEAAAHKAKLLKDNVTPETFADKVQKSKTQKANRLVKKDDDFKGAGGIESELSTKNWDEQSDDEIKRSPRPSSSKTTLDVQPLPKLDLTGMADAMNASTALVVAANVLDL